MEFIRKYDNTGDPILQLLKISRARRVPKDFRVYRAKRKLSKRKQLLNSMVSGLGDVDLKRDVPLDMAIRDSLGTRTDSVRLMGRLNQYIDNQDPDIYEQDIL